MNILYHIWFGLTHNIYNKKKKLNLLKLWKPIAYCAIRRISAVERMWSLMNCLTKSKKGKTVENKWNNNTSNKPGIQQRKKREKNINTIDEKKNSE